MLLKLPSAKCRPFCLGFTLTNGIRWQVLPVFYMRKINTNCCPDLHQIVSISTMKMSMLLNWFHMMWMHIYWTRWDMWSNNSECPLAHWGKYASVIQPIIGSENGLSPDRRQAIIWTNKDISLIEPLGTNFNEIWIKICFSFRENAFENVVGINFCPQFNVLHKKYLCGILKLWCRVQVMAWCHQAPIYYLSQCWPWS